MGCWKAENVLADFKRLKKEAFKGAAIIFSITLKSQKVYLHQCKPKNNGPVLFKITP